MAQTTNVQPVRFSKGKAIPAAVDLNVRIGADAVLTGPLDVSSFEALQILVNQVDGGPADEQGALPNVRVFGALTSEGPWLLLDDTLADYIYPSSQTDPEVYTVANLLPYVRIETASAASAGGFETDGLWNVYAVPIVLSPKLRVEGIDGGAAVAVKTNEVTAPLFTAPLGLTAPDASSPHAVTDVASRLFVYTFSGTLRPRARFQNVGTKTVYLVVGGSGLSSSNIQAPAGLNLGKYGVRLQANEVFEMPGLSYDISAWAVCASGDSSAVAVQFV